MIRFHCSACGMLIQANESAAGRTAKCPSGAAVLEIPRSVGATAAVIPPPPQQQSAAKQSVAAQIAPRTAGNALPRRSAAQPSGPVPPPPPLAAPVPAPPPVVSDGASADPGSLSLDELLGTASAAGNGDANGGLADLDFSQPAANRPARTPKAVVNSAGAKPGAAVARSAGSAKSHAAPTTKIRNLSIAALAAGAIGLALFAIPYAGAAIGAVGAAIGIYCVSLASARRDSPMALALAGAAVSVVAAGIGGFGIYRSNQPASATAKTDRAAGANGGAQSDDGSAGESSAASDPSRFAGAGVKAVVAGAVADARNPLNFATAAVRSLAADPKKRAEHLAASGGEPPGAAAKSAAPAGPVTLRLQGPNGKSDKPALADVTQGDAAGTTDANSNSGSTNSSDGSPPKPAVKPPIHWALVDQGEAQGNDDIKVTVTQAVTGPLFFRYDPNAILGGEQTTLPVLHISVKVQNNQTAGVIDYKGWITLPDADATLVDDKGNTIKRFDLKSITRDGKTPFVNDSHPEAKIEVSQSHDDVIIFQMPPEGTEYVRLKLSGKPVGLPDDLYFQIPRSMIKAGETGNPLLPLAPP